MEFNSWCHCRWDRFDKTRIPTVMFVTSTLIWHLYPYLYCSPIASLGISVINFDKRWQIQAIAAPVNTILVLYREKIVYWRYSPEYLSPHRAVTACLLSRQAPSTNKCTGPIWNIPANLIKGYPLPYVHGASMGPTWVLSVPYGPHDGPMNLAIRVISYMSLPLSYHFLVELVAYPMWLETAIIVTYIWLNLSQLPSFVRFTVYGTNQQLSRINYHGLCNSISM